MTPTIALAISRPAPSPAAWLPPVALLAAIALEFNARVAPSRLLPRPGRACARPAAGSCGSLAGKTRREDRARPGQGWRIERRRHADDGEPGGRGGADARERILEGDRMGGERAGQF